MLVSGSYEPLAYSTPAMMLLVILSVVSSERCEGRAASGSPGGAGEPGGEALEVDDDGGLEMLQMEFGQAAVAGVE